MNKLKRRPEEKRATASGLNCAGSLIRGNTGAARATPICL
jgi:hypothetical protein